MTGFSYHTPVTANTMAGFNIPIINFNSNIVYKFTKGFFKFIIWNWSGYTHNLHTISRRILGICPALPHDVTEAIVELAINSFSDTVKPYRTPTGLVKIVRYSEVSAFWRFGQNSQFLCVWPFSLLYQDV